MLHEEILAGMLVIHPKALDALVKSLIYLLMAGVVALSFDAFAQSSTDLYQVNMTVSRDGTVL